LGGDRATSPRGADLDKWLLSKMGTSVTLDRLYSDLVRTLSVRLTVAEDKNVQTKKVSR